MGQTMLKQNNIVNPRVKPDGVAMGCWPLKKVSYELLSMNYLSVFATTKQRSLTLLTTPWILHCASDQHTMSRHIMPDPKDPTKKLLRNEGFYRAEVSSRGLACNHPGANCDFTPFSPVSRCTLAVFKKDIYKKALYLRDR
jgi:hypothetical protein